MRDPNMRWFEPQHELIGGRHYFTHAWGSIYVLSDHAARTLAKVSAVVPEGLRFFNNEGKSSLTQRACLIRLVSMPVASLESSN